MGRHSSFDGLSSEQEAQFAEDKIISTFRCVCRLFQFYKSGITGVLPVYARSTSRGSAALAVDLISDVHLSARRVLGRNHAEAVLFKICSDGFETIDQSTQIALGAEWTRIDLLGVYREVCKRRTREDSGELHTRRVQWTAEVEAEALLNVEGPEESQDEASINVFGGEDQAAA